MASRTRGTHLVLAILAACSGERPGPPASASVADPVAAVNAFTDVTAEWGIDFIHTTGLAGNHFMPEQMGSGVAIFDYDGDGDLDLYFVNGAANRLYRQDQSGQPASPRYVDVTAAAGGGDPGFGMGATVGDIDGDGDPDLFVTNYGANVLYRNDGGRLVDATAESGIRGDAWSSAACFLDYDGDGDHDLYVARYLDYDPTSSCFGPVGEPAYCTPQSFPGVADTLFQNDGRGHFRDVSRETGIVSQRRRGLGVACTDLTADGRVDVLVANDGEPNILWVNQGDATFADEAIVRGVAVNDMGKAEAGMGVAVGDTDGDGSLDLLLTHLTGETNTLYLNDASGTFVDASAGSPVALASLPMTAFGAAFLDYDLDGDLDLAVTNGRVFAAPGSGDGGHPADATPVERFRAIYGQEDQLFANVDGRLTPVLAGCGDLCRGRQVGRGLAVGDLDRDGDPDLVVTASNGAARILRNDATRGGRSVRIRPVDPGRGGLQIGARVTVWSGRDRAQLREVHTAESYLSSVEPIAQFGIPFAETIARIEVRWPDGVVEEFPPVGLDREQILTRGAGQPTAARPLPIGRGRRVSVSISAPTPPAPATAAIDTIGIASLVGADPVVVTAVAKARAYAKWHPDDGAAWGDLGMLLHAHDIHGDARLCYGRAIALDPASPRWPYLLGLSLTADDPRAALAAFDLAYQRGDSQPALHIRRATALRALGRRGDAEAAYQAALADDEQSVVALVGLAQVELERLAFRESNEHLLAAIEAVGTGPAREIYVALARYHQLHRDPYLARAASARAREQPEAPLDYDEPLLEELDRLRVTADAAVRRAKWLLQTGDAVAALAQLDRAIAQRPDFARAYYNRAVVLDALGESERALADLARSSQLQPSFAGTHIARAKIQSTGGDRAGAIASLTRACEVQPGNAEAPLLRGIEHYHLGHSGAARADLDRAIALDPNAARAYALRAEILRSEGELAAAIADLDEVIRIRPDEWNAYTMRANLRRAVGDLVGAARDLERAKSRVSP